jgi:uncharacterized membrane protein (DUF4010 family)
MELSPGIVLKIIYALGIGVLIGLERSLIPPFTAAVCKHTDIDIADPPEIPDTLLGVRTFSILSLGGFTAALIGSVFPWVAPVIVSGLVIMVVAMYFHVSKQDPGITTEIAAVTCCGLGVLCYTNPHAAGVLALLITTLLALKRFLAGALLHLHRFEFTDTLKFLAIVLIILPLLPNRALGPFDVFNPYKIMFLVILISGISFVGYFLTKFLGAEKGLGLTGLFGGLTSSTAVTAAMANHARETSAIVNPCLFATIIANATMFLRVLVVVAILDPPMLSQLVWPIGTMSLCAGIAVIFLWYGSTKKQPDDSKYASQDITLKNPFSLGPAIKFSLFFVGILFAAKIANIYLGDAGLYLASTLSGLADVDAITLSITEQTNTLQIERTAGAIGITIAVVANSIVKSAIAAYLGGWRFGLRVGMILMGATCAGLVVLLIF